VPDIALATQGGATIVFLRGDAAGSTIDASGPGPSVAELRAPDITSWTSVDDLGDLDGDGRHDLMVAGTGTGEAAYGVRVPRPGQTLDLGDAVIRHDAFVVRWDDRTPDGWGGLESASTLGDETGDGRRELALVTTPGYQRVLRVVFAPAFGTDTFVGDLGATDSRGYSFHPYGPVVDVGDQNGDGRGDFATVSAVYFTDPAAETGTREASYRGFGVDGAQSVIDSVADLNGDGRPEIATVDNSSNGAAIDVYDSIPAPQIGALSPIDFGRDGNMTTTFDVVTGAGHGRSGSPVVLWPQFEIAALDGTPLAQAWDTGPLPATTARTERLTLEARSWTLLGPAMERGGTYKVRLAVDNGRGGYGHSDWETFVDNGPQAPSPPPFPGDPNYPLPTAPPVRHVRTPLPKVIRGTSKADDLWAHDIDERIFGLGGNDRIDGAGGNDFIDGGSGNDKLIGGPGNDDLIGGGGKDKFAGGAGNDWINSFDGKVETIDCGAGKDSVTADKRDRVRHCEKVRRQR
jgi:Ca2+-binding RTX toxin-like protein